MITVPNELKITINTGIQGFKRVPYKPSMSISNISSNETAVQFNPLVKLQQKVVNEVPENLRKIDFVNKSSFQSLINYIDPSSNVSLVQATQRGFIDNNIKVTLDTIFTENSVIYINGKPYVIMDFQWSKGDWKIDTKYKVPEKHYLYTNQLKEQIRIGNEQLEKLPPSVIYGFGYSGPKKTMDASGAIPGTTSAAIPGTTGAAIPGTTGAAIPGTTGAAIPGTTGAAIPGNAPATTNASATVSTNLLNNATLGTPTMSSQVAPPINLTISNNSTSNLRNYFQNQKFYFCINAIFNKMNDREKYSINNFLSRTTRIDISRSELNINKDAYNDSVKSIFVNSVPPDGNCFFTSVADALNYNNYMNETDRVVHGIYGIGNKIFTPTYLRSLVLQYFLAPANSALYETYRQNALANVNELNATFQNHLQELHNASGPGFVLSSEKYVEIASDIYSSSDNFLVNRVTQVPIDVGNYYQPFTVMDELQTKRYLMSKNYWANELAIYALCYEMELNVIPIHKENKGGKKYALKIPFGIFSKTTHNNWSRYLFLYWSEGHYELLSFNFIERTSIRSFNAPPTTSYLTKKRTIFKRNDSSVIAPLCLLFLIFGEYYYSQSDEIKQNFSFCSKIMRLFENKLNEALGDPGIAPLLNANYNAIFENVTPLHSQSGTQTTSVATGGFNGSSYYPNYGTQYTQPYGPNYGSYYGQRYGPNYGSYYGQRYGPNYGSYYGQRYGPNYGSYYGQRNYPSYNNLIKYQTPKVDTINIAYYITIDMELYPGTKIPPEESKNLSCNKKWNSVRKAYADFTGKPYVVPPVYKIDKTRKNKKSQDNIKNVANVNNPNNPNYYYGNNNRNPNYYYGNNNRNNRRNVTRRYYNNY